MTVPVYSILDTWNAGATTFTGIGFNVTDTASAAGSKLLDLQVGGASKFTIRKDGTLTIPVLVDSEIIAAAGTNQATATAATKDLVEVSSGSGGIVLPPATIGRRITIFNSIGYGNTIKVYPAAGEKWGTAGGVSAANEPAFMMGPGGAVVYCTVAGVWRNENILAAAPGTFGIGSNIITGTGSSVSGPTTNVFSPDGGAQLLVSTAQLLNSPFVGGVVASVNAHLQVSQARSLIFAGAGSQALASISASNTVTPDMQLAVPATWGGTQTNSLRLLGVASAVNNILITSSATTTGVKLEAEGADTNIDFIVNPKGTGVLKFGGGAWSANGSVATALSSVGPAGSHTTVQEWFAVKNASGVVRYIPAF